MIIDDVKQFEKLVPKMQMKVIQESEELTTHFIEFVKSLDIPKLYETDGKKDTKAVLHYFNMGAGDWYVWEVDMETGEAFGFVTLSGKIDDPCAEFGYIDLNELCSIASINLDLHFHEEITKDWIYEQKGWSR